MLAGIIGGAKGVWSELEALEAMLGQRPDLVIACNEAGRDYRGNLDGWATLHAEKFAAWRSSRTGNDDYRRFAIKGHHDCNDTEIVAERWAGSSGLYSAQIALDQMGATKAVLCGIPMTRDGRHFFTPDATWDEAEKYRKGFKAALPVIRGSVRSMSGWTRELLGAPCSEWLTNRAAARF